FRALDADRGLADLASAVNDGTPVSFSRANGAIARLELLGLLKNDSGRCAIRNRIYKEALVRQPLQAAPRPARNLRRLTERLLDASDVTTMVQTLACDVQAVLQNRSAAVLTRLSPDGDCVV